MKSNYYSKCHKYVAFGYGCVCEPQKQLYTLRQSAISLWRTSMETAQPQWIDAHEAFYSLRLYNIYSLSGGVLEACDEFSAVRIRTHAQTD